MRFFFIGACLALFFISFLSIAQPQNHFHFTYHKRDNATYKLSLSIAMPHGDALYADTISFSIDHPDIKLSSWKASIEPENKYDAHFKKNKPVFLKPVTLTLTAYLAHSYIESATLHVTLFSRNSQTYEQHQFPIQFKGAQPKNKQNDESPIEKTVQEKSKTHIDEPAPAFQQKILTLFTQTESWTLKVLLTFLFGLLLSLTPCIYPMIPITVGVLQSHVRTSFGSNVIRAVAYVIGMAFMFATLGTIAALSGKMFGSVLCNPFVIIGIVALLVYLAGSMIGFYDMYLPHVLQNNPTRVKSSSLFAIFLFGAASGTVASPCVSPGLVLLLSMVTALGTPLLGFILLFVFGLGLGLPLLIIGTFSGSLHVLPKAGQWMVDVKQFFGFIILATCLYFLAIIMPAYAIALLSAILSCSIGIFYFISANRSESFIGWCIKNMVGIILVASTVYLSYEAYKETDQYQTDTSTTDIWMHDYTHAREYAQTQNKKMFIAISAPYCSICKAIDKKIFRDLKVQKKLSEYVAVKIDDIEENETTQELQKKFTIRGAPTILIYNPITDEVTQRWGSELYEYAPAEFIAYI